MLVLKNFAILFAWIWAFGIKVYADVELPVQFLHRPADLVAIKDKVWTNDLVHGRAGPNSPDKAPLFGTIADEDLAVSVLSINF